MLFVNLELEKIWEIRLERKRVFGMIGIRDEIGEEWGIIGSYAGEVVLIRIENGRVVARVKY